MFHEPLPDDEVGPLVTAFVGNIVDGRNHHFTTRKWKMTAECDRIYWKSLPDWPSSFSSYETHPVSEEALSSHSSVFFRIKETDFIIKPPNREFTISGMYYCAIDRTTCQLHGLYCDPLAIPLQRVEAVLMTPTMKHRMEADKAIEKEGDNDSDDENDDEADAIEATIPIKQARPSFAFSSLR